MKLEKSIKSKEDVAYFHRLADDHEQKTSQYLIHSMERLMRRDRERERTMRTGKTDCPQSLEALLLPLRVKAKAKEREKVKVKAKVAAEARKTKERTVLREPRAKAEAKAAPQAAPAMPMQTLRRSIASSTITERARRERIATFLMKYLQRPSLKRCRSLPPVIGQSHEGARAKEMPKEKANPGGLQWPLRKEMPRPTVGRMPSLEA